MKPLTAEWVQKAEDDFIGRQLSRRVLMESLRRKCQQQFKKRKNLLPNGRAKNRE
jgi:hypothetical protein